MYLSLVVLSVSFLTSPNMEKAQNLDSTVKNDFRRQGTRDRPWRSVFGALRFCGKGGISDKNIVWLSEYNKNKDLDIVGRTNIQFWPEIEIEARTFTTFTKKVGDFIIFHRQVEVQPLGRFKSGQGQSHWRFQNGDRETSCTDQSDTQGWKQIWIHRIVTKNHYIYLHLISPWSSWFWWGIVSSLFHHCFIRFGKIGHITPAARWDSLAGNVEMHSQRERCLGGCCVGQGLVKITKIQGLAGHWASFWWNDLRTLRLLLDIFGEIDRRSPSYHRHTRTWPEPTSWDAYALMPDAELWKRSTLSSGKPWRNPWGNHIEIGYPWFVWGWETMGHQLELVRWSHYGSWLKSSIEEHIWYHPASPWTWIHVSPSRFSWVFLGFHTWIRWKMGCTYNMLVGGLEHEFYFSIYWECHHPTDFHIFQRGRYTTNQLYMVAIENGP